MSEHRAWREQLVAIWPEWDAAIEVARREGHTSLPDLSFPAPPSKKRGDTAHSWIALPEAWADMNRGIGDYVRFALMKYLRSPAAGGAFDPKTVRRLSTGEWVKYIKKACPDKTLVSKGKQGEFDSQVRGLATPTNPAIAERANRLKPLFDDEHLWRALADAANAWRLDHSPQGSVVVALTAEILRNGRFAGPTAILDFITYINTGRVPDRQSPFPDELTDLGVALPSGFERNVTYFESSERDAIVTELASHLADGTADCVETGGACAIASLWSRLQPHGLIATCGEVLKRYVGLCITNNLRRLPIVYIPVGLDAKTQYVSRRAVVRDLLWKLRISRAKSRGEPEIPRQIPENPTGEAVDHAIAEIRAELAAHPALIVFGIHQVTSTTRFSPVAEEILDAPLHYILARLVSETGTFGNLTRPRNAHATRFLVLADGELQTIANLPVESFKLPQCPPEKFSELVSWNRAAHLAALRADAASAGTPLPDIASNEVELSILESMATWAARPGEPPSTGALAQRAIQLVWGSPQSRPGKERTEKLLSALVDHVAQQAETNSDAAWFSTLLHIVALLPGGIRLFTAARILAGYITATAEVPPDPSRSGAQAGQYPTRLQETRALEKQIVRQVTGFEARAAGLVRSFPSAAAAGFDEYDHPFESSEVPAFQFNFADNKLQWEYLAPFVRRVLCEQFRHRQPEKHALLNRLIAEEFIRRAAIVQCHCQERDVRSLVDKRYVIIAIHCALESLQANANALVTAAGRARLRWRIPAGSRVQAFHWIYRWLYVEQLNANEQALSREYGAESLKRALLEQLLESDPLRPAEDDEGNGLLRRPASRNALQHFGIVTDLLHGLVYVSVRTSDTDLAMSAFKRLDDLVHLVKIETADPKVTKQWQLQWQRALRSVDRHTLKLRLDVAVTHGTAFSAGGPGPVSWSHLHRDALRALVDPTSTSAARRAELLAIVRRAIGANRGVDPESWRLAPAVRELRAQIDDDTIQHFYDYLLRYAELVASTAESIAEDERRAQRRARALLLFELAEALRVKYASGTFQENVLKVSSRTLRNAARVCLSLGKYFGDDWYFERAAHYGFHGIGNKSQPVERIALLINQAITIRLRGSAGQLKLAMQYLKTAERALINCSDRTQLMMRFYLERAKLFRERALQKDLDAEEAHWCTYYCRADVATVKRLARNRQAWLDRAERVLKGLPPWPASPGSDSHLHGRLPDSISASYRNGAQKFAT